MKRFLCLGLVTLGILTSVGANAQQTVTEAQVPYVYSSGDFNNGTGDTTLKKWSLTTASGFTYTSTYPCFYTRQDSVTHIATYNDSVRVRLPIYAHSVGFQVKATRSGAVRCDSTTFYVYGDMSYGNGQGAYGLLTSFTMANSSSEQVFTYLINSGIGNPYTNYRITAINGNLSTNSTVLWRAYLLIR